MLRRLIGGEMLTVRLHQVCYRGHVPRWIIARRDIAQKMGTNRHAGRTPAWTKYATLSLRVKHVQRQHTWRAEFRLAHIQLHKGDEAVLPVRE